MRSSTPDGGGFGSVAETLVAGRSALADSAVPARDLLVLLLSHLSTMQRLLAEAAGRGASGMSLTAHRASSRRLRRMLLLLARASAGGRRGRRLDAGTLRRTLVMQLNAHLEVERELLARIDRLLNAADVRALTERYQRLMVEEVAAPRWVGFFDRGRTRGSGQAARFRAAQLVRWRRAQSEGAALAEAPRD